MHPVTTSGCSGPQYMDEQTMILWTDQAVTRFQPQTATCPRPHPRSFSSLRGDQCRSGVDHRAPNFGSDARFLLNNLLTKGRYRYVLVLFERKHDESRNLNTSEPFCLLLLPGRCTEYT